MARVKRRVPWGTSRGAFRAGAAAIVAAVLVVALVVVLLVGVGGGGSSGPVVTSGTDNSTTTSPASASSTAGVSTTEASTTGLRLERRTVGASVQGRPIEVWGVGSGPARMLIIGGVHGDEMGGTVARRLLQYIEKQPEAVPTGLRLQVIPSLNPDGEAAGTRANANGVDLNRNLPTSNWSGTLGSGDLPTTGLGGGDAPGSEPETQALLSVLADGVDLVISLHSEGGIIDYDGPGGSTIAERMSAVSGLPVGHVAYQAQVTGSLGTYAPERYSTPVITIELEGEQLTPGLRTALLTALGSERRFDAGG